MTYIFVGIGGVLGSITRYALGNYISKRSKSAFPVGTFIINVTGAFLLGIVLTFNNDNVYSLVGDGFLGAYTTFSTFMYEGFKLIEGKESLKALKYILSSLMLGIAGFTLGIKIGMIFK